jgi:hypothetical protein
MSQEVVSEQILTRTNVSADSCVKGVHSVYSTDARSVHCSSPGPGLGAWAGEEETKDIAFEYYFLCRPLRLTPQRRYCRGLVASHLILNDAY